uniref:glycosyl hydrolase n=1 Tax=Eubacterium cellulosolvens TaxID=29322 RepID=UPI0004896585|nr:glycosyl hydrolase [[Eubacterium] cellulosolvens]
MKPYLPVNPNATSEARELLARLCQSAGNRLITGQHTQTNPMEEIDYIRKTTGREPLLRGFELLGYSPNINYEHASEACLTEVEENKGTMETALRWAASGDGIVTLSFHWFSPLYGEDKSFYAEHTTFDPEKVLVEGSPERAAFYHDLDEIAGELRRFLDAKIPVLWRPFHESDGTWFWWGSKGPSVARDLYILMYNYYTSVHHLDNLLWVWNCRTADGYPGDAYVDVISVDLYMEQYKATDYADDYYALIKNTTTTKVAALAEIGYLPDPDLLEKSRIPWAYYMCWSKEFCIGEQYNSIENLKRMYESNYAVSLPAST